MTDKEFRDSWELWRDAKEQAEARVGYPDEWAQHIVDKIHTIPIECVGYISQRLPDSITWSDDVVEAARNYVAESIIFAEGSIMTSRTEEL